MVWLGAIARRRHLKPIHWLLYLTVNSGNSAGILLAGCNYLQTGLWIVYDLKWCDRGKRLVTAVMATRLVSVGGSDFRGVTVIAFAI
jgi:hypothetical protein